MTDVIFSKDVVLFLDDLSSNLMHNKEVRLYPDVVTFAFYCRKANILNISKRYTDTKIRLGRGMVFHIAPSNVPVNFAYSLVAGLLAGNSNIVRVPSKNFRQVELIENAIKEVLIKHQELALRIKLVRYDRGGSETDIYSSEADVRVIWGGDNTIAQIRKSIIPPRSFDITFADRYSICIIDATKFPIDDIEVEKIIEGFYNDTYLFDQNACTAPHLVVWVGKEKEVKLAQEKFWNAFYLYEKEKYVFQPIMGVDKLTAFYRQAIDGDVERVRIFNNSLWRVRLKKIKHNIDVFRCAGGYFSEFVADNLEEIAPIINQKYQTMAYYGFNNEVLKGFILNNRIKGIDRIVPIGKTTEFDLVWDGYDLIERLSREITIK